MTEVYYDTHLLESGPWLLSEAALIKLDEIVTAEWGNLRRRREVLVEARVTSHIKRYYANEEIDKKRLSAIREREEGNLEDKRRLKISCRGGKSISVATFAEALRSPEAMGERPKGFVLSLECADVHAEIELRGYDGKIDLSVRPVEAPEARELFVELRRWVLEFRPPAWQRIWRNYFGLHWIIWALALWLSLIPLSQSPDGSRQATIAEGQQLLVGGLNDQEVRPAVETLLKLAVDKNEGERPIPSWLKILFFGGFGMCILLSFTPRSSLAVGGGAQVVKFWQWWAQLVGITLPIFLFSTFVWPYLESFIKAIF